MFGQPVKRGHVRVVRETEREWNYRNQKWDIEEAEKYEGDTNAAGSFGARIDLSKCQKELGESSYQRFRDVTYTAYFTDPSTGRTEQQRFDLRVTRERIHVYIIPKRYNQVANSPATFYVSASYADGTPAECDLFVRGVPAHSRSERGAPLRFRTNRQGLARIDEVSIGAAPLDLRVLARDREGNSGKHNVRFEPDESGIQIETNKALYRPGEPIQVDIAATEPDGAVVIDVMRAGELAASQIVHLANGRAKTQFPYADGFKGELTLTAYTAQTSPGARNQFLQDSLAVLFPLNTHLGLEVQMSQPTYRPGEEARADFSVRGRRWTNDGERARPRRIR